MYMQQPPTINATIMFYKNALIKIKNKIIFKETKPMKFQRRVNALKMIEMSDIQRVEVRVTPLKIKRSMSFSCLHFPCNQ